MNPAEYAQRIKSDPEAAALVLQEAAAKGINPIDQARGLVAQEHVSIVRATHAEAVAAFEALPEAEQAKFTDPATSGGFYGWMREYGRREATVTAVEAFKKSPAYAAEIAAAKEEGAHEALRSGGNGSAPATEGAPPSTRTRVDTGNPWSDAAADSAQELGRTVDPTAVRGAGRRAVRSA